VYQANNERSSAYKKQSMPVTMFIPGVHVKMRVRRSFRVGMSVGVNLPTAFSHRSPRRGYAECYQHPRNRYFHPYRDVFRYRGSEQQENDAYREK
jgi:hypothetical protein